MLFKWKINNKWLASNALVSVEEVMMNLKYMREPEFQCSSCLSPFNGRGRGNANPFFPYSKILPRSWFSFLLSE